MRGQKAAGFGVNGLWGGWRRGGGFGLGAAGQGGGGDLDDDFIHLADGGGAGGGGGEVVPLFDGGEQEIELALQFRAVLGEGGQGFSAFGGGFFRHDVLEGTLRGAQLVEERQEVEGGEIRSGRSLCQIGDEGGHFSALAIVSEAVEGVAMEGDDCHEAGGSGTALGRGDGVLHPGGAIIAQRAESGVAGGIGLFQGTGIITARLAGGGEDDGGVMILRSVGDGDEQRIPGNERGDEGQEPGTGGAEFLDDEQAGVKSLHGSYVLISA